MTQLFYHLTVTDEQGQSLFHQSYDSLVTIVRDLPGIKNELEKSINKNIKNPGEEEHEMVRTSNRR